MFTQVALGPHESSVGEMLRADDPRAQDEYALAVQALVMDDRIVYAALMEPVQFRFRFHRVYTFIFGGCAWNFLISAKAPPPFAALTLTRDGKLPIMKQEFTKLDLIRDFAADHLRTRRRLRLAAG
jgi:hypothetical protein